MHAVKNTFCRPARGSALPPEHAAPVELVLAIRAVVRGTYLSPPISKVVITNTCSGPGVSGIRVRLIHALRAIDVASARSFAVDRGRAYDQGYRPATNLSVRTVETHRTELMQRLDIHDVAGLVRYAIRTGLVSSDT